MTVSDLAEAFSGQWEDAWGGVVEISGTTLTCSDGKVLPLEILGSGDVIAFKRGPNLYEGKLIEGGESLEWPGGTVWVRSHVATARRGAKTHVPAPQRPTLTLEQALSLQEELREGFSDPEFQRRLKDLKEAGGWEPNELVDEERSRLFLTVQSFVLPKYGFEPNRKGVIDMLEAGAQFKNNEQYKANRDKLNSLLGFVDLDEGLSVVARHVFEDVELQLIVPRGSTFGDLKTAIADRVGRTEILEKGHIVKKEKGIYSPYKDDDSIGDTRSVLVFRASLKPAEQLT
eukprot:CAMPEP_0197902488 /NCGR_PEP_ID=MMETSP1439-20131203/53576_1 /TAXON_ID=66791 /ORGANISM="Gonyaulax spinifera, Strain CCMP409" /LENGTH=286 /DNA_ID=CAMNT_0043523517 /DNA_START=59 /DNA_END=919 /DNA_ORIENTATION=+